MFCQHIFLPLGLPEIVPYYEVKVHIWKILLFFPDEDLESDGYGEEFGTARIPGNRDENKYELKSKHH